MSTYSSKIIDVTMYQITLHPEDAFYEDRHLIEGKPFFEDRRNHHYLVKGFAYCFANDEDLRAFQAVKGDTDHINIYSKSKVDYYIPFTNH